MLFKHFPALLLLALGGWAQDPQQSPNADVLATLSTQDSAKVSISSCLMDEPCHTAGKRITIDDIVSSYDSNGNQKCCPRGTEYNGVSCVYPKSSVCPPNMDFRNGFCVLKSGPVCADKSLVPTADGCVSRVPPQCPSHTRLQNGHCVLIRDPTCPPGQTLKGQYCVVVEVPECPDKGFYVKNNLCVSVDGPSCPYDWLKADGDRCITVKLPGCPDNTKLDNQGRCVSTEPPSCPPGFKVFSNRCIKSATPSCPSGAKLEKGVCVSDTTPTCIRGTPIGGFCVDSEEPGCDRGFKFDGASGFCQQRNPPVCPSGFVNRYHKSTDSLVCCPSEFGDFDGVACSKKNSGSPSECPANSEPVGGRCVSKPGELPVCDGGKGIIIKGICYTRQIATCPSNLKLKNGRCVHDESPYCTEGTLSPSGTHCVVEGPECPDDSLVVGRECVSTSHTPTCPKGLRLVGEVCVIESWTECPAGTTKSGQYCVHPIEKPLCKGSTTLFGEDCVLPIVPTCPEGTMTNGNICVSLQNPSCNSPGFRWSSTEGACISISGPVCHAPYRLWNGKCFAEAEPACPTGTVAQQGLCVTTANCTGDYTLEGNRCVHHQKPKCEEADTELDEKTGSCVSRAKTPTCPKGQMTDEGKCITQALCPPGLTPSGGYCVSLVPIRCEDGFRLQGNHCVLVTGATCPPGHKPSGTECVSVDPPVCPPGTYQDRDRCITGASRDCFIMGDCPEVA